MCGSEAGPHAGLPALPHAARPLRSAFIKHLTYRFCLIPAMPLCSSTGGPYVTKRRSQLRDPPCQKPPLGLRAGQLQCALIRRPRLLGTV